MSRPLLTGSLLAAVFLCAAAQAPNFPALWRPEIPLGLDLYMPIPEDNPLTPEKVALGRRLFFDPILSHDFTLSCATCHDPRRAFTDGLPLAVGVEGRSGVRHAPALLNRAWGKSQFWDGRAASLEEQALQPLENPNEFDMTLEEVITRLKSHSDYPALFQSAFAHPPNKEDLGRALASYVRTILAGNAPIDRYFDGEPEALTAEARQGLRLFRGKAKCTACHLGPTFTDEDFHNTGVAWREEAFADPGRFAVTGKEEDRGAFKTPTLRQLARTAPYMHDGSLKTLEEVIEFYNAGGRPNSHLDPEIKLLKLTEEERQALVAFLRSLTGTIYEGRTASSPN